MLLWKGAALAPVGACALNRMNTILDIWDSFCLTTVMVRFGEIAISFNKPLFVRIFLYIIYMHCFQRVSVNCDSFCLIELNFDAFALRTFERNQT